jgi:diaminopimelate decarboxylase
MKYLDLGGGLGVAYHCDETAPSIETFISSLGARVRASGLTVMIEPGRSIVGPAGVLLTRVLYRKRNGAKEFVVVDAAMNDLIRPALYRAHHEILPLRKNALPMVTADVVGPVCETGDFLARDRHMVNAMPGDYLAVCTAGMRLVQRRTTIPPGGQRSWWKPQARRRSNPRNRRPGPRRSGLVGR